MRDVVPALCSWISDHKSSIDTVLMKYRQEPVNVYDHEHLAIDTLKFPCIVVGNGSVNSEWWAAPNTIVAHYEVEIYGYHVHDDPELSPVIARDFAGELQWVFQQAHDGKIAFTLPVANRLWEVFYDAPVVPGGEYEINYTEMGSVILSSFSMTWRGSVVRGLTEGK